MGSSFVFGTGTKILFKSPDLYSIRESIKSGIYMAKYSLVNSLNIFILNKLGIDGIFLSLSSVFLTSFYFGMRNGVEYARREGINSEFLKVEKIDKFIHENKYQTENISLYIKFLDTKEIKDFRIYSTLLNSLSNSKLYTDFPYVWSLLVQNVSENDLLSFVDICNKLPTNSIQKCKGSSYLQEIIKNMINLSEELYLKKWEYECTVVLYTISLFITINGIQSDTSKYYKLLGDILINQNLFYSFSLIGNIDDRISELLKYKNEGNNYLQLLLKINTNISNPININYNIDNENWNFYIKNIGHKITFKDNIKFLSFMNKNNLTFKKEGDLVEILDYKYLSVNNKVHNIINRYKEKKEIKEIKKKQEIKQEIKIQEKTKKEIIFEDNYTIRKAKYNIYCEILRNRESREMYYEIREMNRIKEEEKYKTNNKSIEDNISKDENNINFNINDSKLKENDLEYKTDNIVKPVSKNWRDDDLEESVVYKPVIKKEELVSDRVIYTYGGNSIKTDAYTPPTRNNKNVVNKDMPYRPSLDIPYRPNINIIDKKEPNINNKDTPYTPTIYKKETSSMSNKDTPYTPKINKKDTPYTPTINKKDTTLENKNSDKNKWYD